MTLYKHSCMSFLQFLNASINVFCNLNILKYLKYLNILGNFNAEIKRNKKLKTF